MVHWTVKATSMTAVEGHVMVRADVDVMGRRNVKRRRRLC
jgi:hypothetical protein